VGWGATRLELSGINQSCWVSFCVVMTLKRNAMMPPLLADGTVSLYHMDFSEIVGIYSLKINGGWPVV